MLRRFQKVRRWAEADDAFQGAAVRLVRALGAVPVADTREFLNLAAAQVRRELLDLTRHFYGPDGVGANHASSPDGSAGPVAPDGVDPAPGPADLERWAALHEAAGRLPADEREVFGLVFYHGWTRQQVAEPASP
jgi:RNA polymerase sigma-70 factor (ECF subfamily)